MSIKNPDPEHRTRMKIEKFKDIDAWKEGRRLVNMLYDASSDGEFARDFALKDQIRSASISIMSNISEDFDRGSDKEFIQFLNIARTFAAEVKSQLYIALDRNYISQNNFDTIYEQATKVISLINGFIRYLKKPRT